MSRTKMGLRIQDEDIIFGRWSQDPTKTQVIKWVDEHGGLPDAFICANDLMALGVYDALEELGYHVPDDVLVTGFDNIKVSRDMQPPLATVSRDWHAMGQKAMQLLPGQDRGLRYSDSHCHSDKLYLPSELRLCNARGSKAVLPHG